MNIYVSNEVNYLKEELNKKGYTVIEEKQNIECEAIICDLKNKGLINLLKMENNIKGEGTLIIDCNSKTVEEIENIINHKSYSSII